MEALELMARPGCSPDPSFWAGRRVLLTGHTGFKGSWLALWLLKLGARVTGVALDPDTSPSLFGAIDLAAAALPGELQDSRADIRDADALAALVAAADPEVVLHLAAQPWCAAATSIPSAPGPPM